MWTRERLEALADEVRNALPEPERSRASTPDLVVVNGPSNIPEVQRGYGMNRFRYGAVVSMPFADVAYVFLGALERDYGDDAEAVRAALRRFLIDDVAPLFRPLVEPGKNRADDPASGTAALPKWLPALAALGWAALTVGTCAGGVAGIREGLAASELDPVLHAVPLLLLSILLALVGWVWWGSLRLWVVPAVLWLGTGVVDFYALAAVYDAWLEPASFVQSFPLLGKVSAIGIAVIAAALTVAAVVVTVRLWNRLRGEASLERRSLPRVDS